MNANTDIIILRGSSSAGKTSICKALEQVDTSWKAIIEDEICMDMETNSWQEHFNDYYKPIEDAIAYDNIFNAVKRSQIVFKLNITDDHKKLAMDSIYYIRGFLDDPSNLHLNKKVFAYQLKNKIIEVITQNLIAGYKIIIDDWLLDNELIEKFRSNYNIKYILAYSPLDVVINRTIKRNQDACANSSMREAKFFEQPINSFFANFELSLSEENAIDKIEKSECISALENVDKYLDIDKVPYKGHPLFHRREMTKQELQEIIFNINHIDTNILFVVPKISNNHLIFTGTYSSKECALHILELAKS